MGSSYRPKIIAVAFCVVASTSRQCLAQSTEDFITAISVCAGGANIQIDAHLLGSIQTIYDGDQTVGTLSFTTQAEFMKHFGPNDNLADVLKVYDECVLKLIAHFDSRYRITEQLLDFNIKLDIPIDLYAELGNRNEEVEHLLQKDGYFEHYLNDFEITFAFSKHRCAFNSLQEYDGDKDFYAQVSLGGSLTGGKGPISNIIWSDIIGGRQIFFGGNGWNGDNFVSRWVPTAGDELESVTQLVGKCVYVEFTSPFKFNFQYVNDAQVRSDLESFSDATFATIGLNDFRLKLSDSFAIGPSIQISKVFISPGRGIFAVALPTSAEDFKLR